MSVQVVRTLVYTYPDHEIAKRDMGAWAIPANGVRLHIGQGKAIHSSTTPMQTLKQEAEAHGEKEGD